MSCDSEPIEDDRCGIRNRRLGGLQHPLDLLPTKFPRRPVPRSQPQPTIRKRPLRFRKLRHTVQRRGPCTHLYGRAM